MPLLDVAALVRVHVPDPNGLVEARGRDHMHVLEPHQVRDPVRVPLEGQHPLGLPFGVQVPEPDGPVQTPGQQRGQAAAAAADGVLARARAVVAEAELRHRGVQLDQRRPVLLMPDCPQKREEGDWFEVVVLGIGTGLGFPFLSVHCFFADEGLNSDRNRYPPRPLSFPSPGKTVPHHPPGKDKLGKDKGWGRTRGGGVPKDT